VTIAVVIAVLAVLVVAAIIWARVSAARSENKSVETYEHALGVLGEVSKRTESRGFRILPHEETGRAHVGKPVDPAGGEAAPAEGPRMYTSPPLASRRLPPAGEPKLRFSRPGAPASSGSEDASDDDEVGPARVGTPVAADVRGGQAGAELGAQVGSHPHRTVYKSAADRQRQVMARRAATGVAAAAALVAVVVAAIYLSSSGGGGGRTAAGGKSTSTTTTSRHSGGGGSTTTTPTSTSTTVPTSLEPTSSSPVTFTVPSDSYTLSFQATGGPCWVGIERTTAGPWLFAQTLVAGQSGTYKASGALLVDLGAPSHFSLSVDGLTADLPSGVTQAYSFDLTPAST
jgi:hypothetical protein